MRKIKVRSDYNQAFVGSILLDKDMSDEGIPFGLEEKHIRKLGDFPTPDQNRNIQLQDNVTYWIRGTVNLGGNKLVGGVNTCVLGTSSENSIIVSSLQSDETLISSQYTMPIRHISLNAGDGSCIFFNGDGVNNAYDWFGVNFVGGKVGTIRNCSNFVVQSMALLGATEGFIFDGNVGTVSFRDFFSLLTPNFAIKVANTCVVSRRFRLLDSSIIRNNSNEGMNVSTSSTIPIESYILDNVNFNEVNANNLVGVQFDDNKALFTKCTNITNSAKVGAFIMQDNATATTVLATETYYKVAGTTTPLAINQKFNHENNKLTYVGAITTTFEVTGVATLTSSNNNQIGITVFLNGVETSGFEQKVTASGSGRAENVSFFWVGELSTDDYIEVFVENYTGTNNITVESLFLKIRPTQD